MNNQDNKAVLGQPSASGASYTFIGQPLAVQQLYANGFALNLTAADVGIVLLRDNVASANISLSFTTAKTLLETLKDAIDKLEKATGQTIMTIDVVQSGLEKQFPQNKKDDNV